MFDPEKVLSNYEIDLARMVEIPSVSATPDSQPAIRDIANLAKSQLEAMGMVAEILETGGNPVVYGQHVSDPRYPTVLIYNHLDVQPADPTEWDNDPFELRVDHATGTYYGRGTTDDKGPALAVMYAVRQAIQDGVPLNFKFVLETEEEIGSPHFADFVATHAEKLSADSVLVSDTMWISSEIPSVACGLRGLAALNVFVKTGDKPIHSGLAGGLAPDANRILNQLIASMFDDESDEFQIPGFYDDIIPVSPEEIDSFVASGFSIVDFKNHFGLYDLSHNEVREAVQAIMSRPSYTVHSMHGGPTGGLKTVVANSAEANLSFRLVPGQDPDRIFDITERYIHSQYARAAVTKLALAAPLLIDHRSPYHEAISAAYYEAIQKKPAFVREGGSIGAVLALSNIITPNIILAGFSLPTDGYHEDNEKFTEAQALTAMRVVRGYFSKIAQIKYHPID